MDIFDFINELRTGTPDVKKAEKGMKALGWICLIGAVWNAVLYHLFPFNGPPFNLPSSFPYIALISLSSIGLMFLFAAKGIREQEASGVTVGQMAIAILLMLMFSTFLIIPEPFKEIIKQGGGVSYVFAVFFVLAMLQFILPAYFGIRYLGRLPISNDPVIKPPRSYDELAKPDEVKLSAEIYNHSPFPFNLHVTFVIVIACILLSSFAALKFGGPEMMAGVMGPMFIIGVFGPVAYNFVPSPFQKKRTALASFTGGCSITFFNASWPFCRLILYDDGLEIRVEFQRYFIPYDKMEAPPEKLGFFSRGLLIKSDLPGVPSRIRFQGFGMKKILAAVRERRRTYIAQSSIKKAYVC